MQLSCDLKNREQDAEEPCHVVRSRKLLLLMAFVMSPLMLVPFAMLFSVPAQSRLAIYSLSRRALGSLSHASDEIQRDLLHSRTDPARLGRLPRVSQVSVSQVSLLCLPGQTSRSHVKSGIQCKWCKARHLTMHYEYDSLSTSKLAIRFGMPNKRFREQSISSDIGSPYMHG